MSKMQEFLDAETTETEYISMQVKVPVEFHAKVQALMDELNKTRPKSKKKLTWQLILMAGVKSFYSDYVK